MRVLWWILAIFFGLAFVGVLFRLFFGFGAMLLSGRILWLVLLLVMGGAAGFLIGKAVRARR